MPISRMDHFTIVTKDTAKTVEFYRDMMNFEVGPRPNFSFPGAWLWSGGSAVLHVIEKKEMPGESGVLDHMAFWGTDLKGYIAKLRARNMKYDLRRLPMDGHGGGIWQLFFFDPSNARVEIDFAATEPGPEGVGSM